MEEELLIVGSEHLQRYHLLELGSVTHFLLDLTLESLESTLRELVLAAHQSPKTLCLLVSPL